MSAIGRGALIALICTGSVRAIAEPLEGCRARARVGRGVSADEAERLRLLPSTTRAPREGEYRLRDGRVLVQPDRDGEGVVYERAEYAAYRAALDEELRFRRVTEGESFHLLRGLIDDGSGFATQVAPLIRQLERRLAGAHLAATPDGVAAYVARWREQGCRLDPSLFRELTAWAGELARRQGDKGASWSTLVGDGGVVEPIVDVAIAGQERRVAPWSWVARLLDGVAGAPEATVAELLDETRPPPAPAPAPARTVTADGPDALHVAPAKVEAPARGNRSAADPALDPGLSDRPR